jgi:hypothetical protein
VYWGGRYNSSKKRGVRCSNMLQDEAADYSQTEMSNGLKMTEMIVLEKCNRGAGDRQRTARVKQGFCKG